MWLFISAVCAQFHDLKRFNICKSPTEEMHRRSEYRGVQEQCTGKVWLKLHGLSFDILNLQSWEDRSVIRRFAECWEESGITQNSPTEYGQKVICAATSSQYYWSGKAPGKPHKWSHIDRCTICYWEILARTSTLIILGLSLTWVVEVAGQWYNGVLCIVYTQFWQCTRPILWKKCVTTSKREPFYCLY